ncbi:MAG TPA: hypothetical protein P5136_00875 [Methanofastidiosum sp.]|nr:hypothetical protein [Methanofastidiosum sp.]
MANKVFEMNCIHSKADGTCTLYDLSDRNSKLGWDHLTKKCVIEYLPIDKMKMRCYLFEHWE